MATSSRTIQRIPRPIVKEPVPVQTRRTLFCQICEDWTAHTITDDGYEYVCSVCGAAITYIVNTGPAMWAIR